MPQRKNVSSGRPYEKIIGYSRAVRMDNVSNIVAVCGTTAIDLEGKVVGKGDPYAQTKKILEIIQEMLGKAGASFENVIRTRVYVVDVHKNWEVVGKAHGEVFGDIRPACTLIGVDALADPDMLVEIDADAVV